MSVQIQLEPIDVSRETAMLMQSSASIGALVSFTGLVRDLNEGKEVSQLTLEHYPGMTEKQIKEIIQQARARWLLEAVRVVHRVGVLKPTDPIVYVGVASQHRGDAFKACEFIMDYLKTQAPFWKKESTNGTEQWLESRASDQARLLKWQEE